MFFAALTVGWFFAGLIVAGICGMARNENEGE